jgi:ATP/maltotriose-dependent transcriptional regulator MalT
MLGHGDLVDTVARSAPEAIEQTPECWIVVALHRWLSGDYAGATHWYERIIHVHEQDPRTLAPGAALLRLMLARTAREPAIVAVENALRVIDGEDTRRHPSALITWLLIELGAAENWVGRLREAQTHLRWAASAAESGGIDRLVAAALSHTALTEYMQGRHLNARVSAARALDLLPDDSQDLATVARARVAQELADRPQLSEMPDLIDLSSPASSPAVTDPTTAVWHCVLTSRTLLAEGSVDEAAAALTATRMLPPLPPHLAAAIIGEKAVHALLQNDAAGLVALSGSFAAVGARGESALVAAFDRDRAGDTRTAVELLGAVVSGREECLLPGTRVVAMIYKAQLDDARGDPEGAEGLLADAVHRSATQRDSDPFVGWSVNGTPTSELLRRLAQHGTPSAWLVELCAVADERSGFAALVKAAREAPTKPHTLPQSNTGHVHIPGLTRREHDVLVQLANGSSYADIAEALFVSENTVKTHVSSLYAKLGATRRSQALKIARSQRLL